MPTTGLFSSLTLSGTPISVGASFVQFLARRFLLARTPSSRPRPGSPLDQELKEPGRSGERRARIAKGPEEGQPDFISGQERRKVEFEGGARLGAFLLELLDAVTVQTAFDVNDRDLLPASPGDSEHEAPDKLLAKPVPSGSPARTHL